jgi:hypothetical protein
MLCVQLWRYQAGLSQNLTAAARRPTLELCCAPENNLAGDRCDAGAIHGNVFVASLRSILSGRIGPPSPGQPKGYRRRARGGLPLAEAATIRPDLAECGLSQAWKCATSAIRLRSALPGTWLSLQLVPAKLECVGVAGRSGTAIPLRRRPLSPTQLRG